VLNGLAGWFLTGATTGILAPLVMLAARGRTDRFRFPPVAVAGGFIVVHGAITLSLLLDPPLLAWVGEHVVLLAGAMLFWLPVLARNRHLAGDAKFVYLLVTSSMLDLAGVVVVGLGHPDDGLAMIVGMLPVNGAAVVIVWQWMRAEERRPDTPEGARAVEAYNLRLHHLHDEDPTPLRPTAVAPPPKSTP
jgi:hypothetical protein